MFRFALPWMLLLYIPLLAVLILALRKKRPTLRVPWLRPFKEANPGGRLHPVLGLPFLMHAVGLALLIFALARPQKGIELLKQKAEGIDIMLAIDLSGSMDAVDIETDGKYKTMKDVQDALRSGELKKRIEIAKEEIRKFIERRPNDRIGLIAFAPLPYVACPPTLDHAWLFKHLDNLEAGIIGDATGIAGPIASAVHRLKDSNAKRKVVVLFTDGSNNVDARITPRQAAKLAKRFGVVIYTVGIGSASAYVIRHDPFRGMTLYPLGSQFDEKLLKDIAYITNGRYYTAADSKGLEKAMREINKMEKTTREQPVYVDYSELGPKIVLAGLALILLAFILENTLAIKVP